jgi:peroxiredoxin
MSGAARGSAPEVGAPREREALPLFTLPNTRGRNVRLWDFKQRRPVVLLFIHGADCPACRQALVALAGRTEELRQLHAAVLAIAPEPLDRLARLREALALPFNLLADTDCAVTARYLPPGLGADGRAATGLFVADRYGECGLAATAAEATELPDADAILAEIVQADESRGACSVPAWPDVPHI